MGDRAESVWQQGMECPMPWVIVRRHLHWESKCGYCFEVNVLEKNDYTELMG